jgi:hypothetical protein
MTNPGICPAEDPTALEQEREACFVECQVAEAVGDAATAGEPKRAQHAFGPDARPQCLDGGVQRRGRRVGRPESVGLPVGDVVEVEDCGVPRRTGGDGPSQSVVDDGTSSPVMRDRAYAP